VLCKTDQSWALATSKRLNIWALPARNSFFSRGANVFVVSHEFPATFGRILVSPGTLADQQVLTPVTEGDSYPLKNVEFRALRGLNYEAMLGAHS